MSPGHACSNTIKFENRIDLTFVYEFNVINQKVKLFIKCSDEPSSFDKGLMHNLCRNGDTLLIYFKKCEFLQPIT